MSEIRLKKMVNPAFNRIITTANKYKSDTTASGLYDTQKNTSKYMDIQTVVAVGPKACGVEVGDIVSLSFARYKERPFKNSLSQDDPQIQKMTRDEVYHIPSLIIAGVEYFLLGDNDVEFTIPKDGYEEIEESPLIHPDTSLIV